MLQSVKRAFAIDSNNAWLHECLIKFSKSGKYKEGVFIHMQPWEALSAILHSSGRKESAEMQSNQSLPDSKW